MYQAVESQPDYQYRNGGMGGMSGMGGLGNMGGMGGWDTGEVGFLVPQHIQPHQQMHQPIPRRPITGNSYSHAPTYPRPTHYQTSPAPGPPPQPQFINNKPYASSWGSPSWSGSGPPPAPPPISMTPPPISWGQPPGQARRPPCMGGGGGRNKPFGNLGYGGQQGGGASKPRSKNYPFPARATTIGENISRRTFYRFYSFLNIKCFREDPKI